MEIETPASGVVLGRPRTEAAHPRELPHRPGRHDTLLEIVAQTARRGPARLALEAPDGSFTYAELTEAAADVAERLAAHGIGRGDRVLINITSGRSELYVAILGTLTAGAAYVPVDADDPAERLRDIRQRSGACARIGDGLAIELSGPAPCGDLGAPRAEDDAWIIFTSGTTGAPKGVAVTHRSAAAFVDGEARLWQVLPQDRVLAGLSVGFDASCEEIWLAWANGAALLPAPRSVVRAGMELGTWLVDNRVTVVSTVPTLAALWDESCLHNVRLLILGGEACPEKLGWRLAAGREVWNTYGPTEATVVSTAAPIIPSEPITIGHPLHGGRVAVLDGDRPVAPGEVGELVIGGIGLGRYLDSELDAERYAGIEVLGWARAYRTGDLVRETAGGLQFVGRRDDQVKIGGRRIELGEVEAALQAHSGVEAAAVAVRESASGNRLLVGYIVAGEDICEDVRRFAAQRLPASLVPLIVRLPELPATGAGKVDRRALPWPLGDDAAALADGIAADGTLLSGHEVWVAEQWTAQLGPIPITAHSDFFAAGGTSLAAAKLISAVRQRYPGVAVADLYTHPTLRTFAQRLEAIGRPQALDGGANAPRNTFARLLQLLCLVAVFVVETPDWLAGILAFDHWFGVGPQLPWGWIIGGWLLLASAPARALFAVAVRRVLLRGLRPGRYPRNGWTCFRVQFVERISDASRLDGLAGTPWAGRYARLCGHRVGAGVSLGTLPPASALVDIGAGATIEGDVDMHGWWIDGQQFVLGRVSIGAGARVATRALLMPDAIVEAGAEVEVGTVVSGRIPAGERWAGAPARRIGAAGDHWPAAPAVRASRAGRRRWSAVYAFGFLTLTALPLLAAAPGVALMLLASGSSHSSASVVWRLIALAPAFALLFTLCFALLVAAGVRALGALIRPGWHAGPGATAWAMWMTDRLFAETRGALFPLYASSFTNRWLRLCGLTIGERTEISTAAGLTRLTRFGSRSFAADDIALVSARSRGGWTRVEPLAVGSGTFLGNGAILTPGTRLGDNSLVGLVTVAPRRSHDGSSWLGHPALELPRRPQRADPARTTDPPLRLRIARRGFDCVRILFPSSVTVALGAGAYGVLDSAGGIPAMALLTPLLLLAMGICGAAITIAVKWLLIGRYRVCERPFYSHYVWRDELINSCQEQLAGALLLKHALGTILLPLYLRLMGAHVGRDVWIENMNTTEFDLAHFGDGAVVNRSAVVETHLIHDRIMSTGTVKIGAGATLGPYSVSLPDTVIGDGTSVGGRSIVMRGEELPAGTRWHGAPVVAQ
jgi:non-ribosomal peptide synthetase-like protein